MNNRGVTLVELLATIVILSIVVSLAYQVLLQGQSNYERVKLETELRDEADLIMASLIKHLFTVKESEIHRDLYGPDYILTVERIENDGSINRTETGIKAGKALVENHVIEFYNEHIKLINGSSIVYKGEGLYEITIILQNKNKQMEFTNTINTIYDKAD